MPRSYRASRLSLSPMILPTREAEANLKKLDQLQGRYLEAQKFVVLEAATLMMRLLKRTGPDIDGFSYKRDLEAVFSVDSNGEVTFSFIGRQSERPSDPAINEVAYLYSKGSMSPDVRKWFNILSDYQVWPVSMYPMPTEDSPVGLTVRRVSAAALREAKERIVGDKAEIERRMSAIGFPVTIADSSDSKMVQTDLAFAILQTEYGLGRRADSHWRPAIEALKGEMRVLPDKFKRFIVSGNKAIFDIDNDIIEVSNIEMLSEKLQERLARSTGLSVDRL